MSASKPRAAISWSGGKDSCAALHRVHAHYDVVSMVTMFDEEVARSRSHGLRPEVIAAQADRLGLPRIAGRCTWQTYDAAFHGAWGVYPFLPSGTILISSIDGAGGPGVTTAAAPTSGPATGSAGSFSSSSRSTASSRLRTAGTSSVRRPRAYSAR